MSHTDTWFCRGRRPLVPQDEEWDSPVPRFERFVSEVVRLRIGKYVQPGHPAQLDPAEAMQVGGG